MLARRLPPSDGQPFHDPGKGRVVDDPLETQLPHPSIWRFSSNDTGLSNFRFERVAPNSFIQAARMYRGRDFQFGAR